ncbi:hypothetical protein ACLKA7_001800 [Drosophila subpalustris]
MITTEPTFRRKLCGGARECLPPPQKAYRADTFNTQAFAAAIQSLDITGSADTMATQMAAQLAVACDGSMARRRPYVRHHVPAYWWNERIASARQACLHARRRYTRSRGRQTFLERQLEYKTARRILKNEIRKSKRECFLELCDSAEYDPWGKAYKTVVKRINAGNQTAPTEALEVKRIVETLFPSSPIIRNFNAATTSTDSIMLITADEILAASRSLKPNKAPGPDGIPNRALRALSTPSYCRGICSVYRLSAIRVSCAFRKISDEAALVIAGMIPITELIAESGKIHEAVLGAGETTSSISAIRADVRQDCGQPIGTTQPKAAGHTSSSPNSQYGLRGNTER